ncbi:MAG TPA: hypothetical protein VNR60_11450 [Croceibacterium sp.]|nr:hypothetical protein [Croceibacterium sp.]
MLVLTGCHSDSGDGTSSANIPAGDSHPYAEIAEAETLRFIGTEPFWGGQVANGSLLYTTPEDESGQTIKVERFAGRGGLSFNGELNGASLVMTATPSQCSDGMSDRTYPFAVVLKIGGETRNGCAWSDIHPFEGPEAP